MGLIAQCDGGCGATTDDVSKFKEFGIVKKVWYCEKYKVGMKQLYDDRDSLHTRYADRLARDLLISVAAFRQVHPKARLPDAPE